MITKIRLLMKSPMVNVGVLTKHLKNWAKTPPLKKASSCLDMLNLIYL